MLFIRWMLSEIHLALAKRNSRKWLMKWRQTFDPEFWREDYGSFGQVVYSPETLNMLMTRGRARQTGTAAQRETINPDCSLTVVNRQKTERRLARRGRGDLRTLDHYGAVAPSIASDRETAHASGNGQ
jgi:hypothetical protein